MSERPLVSIVVPVYNTQEYVRESLGCLLSQTYDNIEILCVNDGSTDDSLKILQECAAEDARIHVFDRPNAGAGAARNYGFSQAKGEYALFFDSDDLCKEDLVEKALTRVLETEADIIAYNYTKFTEDGTETSGKGIHTEHMPKGMEVFSYRDFPNYIMSIINPVPWNKLYRSSFIRENDLHFEEISSTNDITFAAVSAAKAERIAFLHDELVRYRVGQSGTITKTKVKNTGNVITAVESALRQVKELSYYPEIKGAAQRFAVDNYVFALQRYTNDFRSGKAEEFYNYVHQRFTEEDLNDAEEALYLTLAKWYRIIKKYDYQEFFHLYDRKIVASVTTFPDRIKGMRPVLDSILDQSRPADEVVLWLADSQFPEGTEGLPEDLMELVNEGKVTIRFCKDLKAHKKYFYAFSEYADDLIVTFDDDLLYYKDSINELFLTYLEFPHSVPAMRAHLMVFDEEQVILPYNHWFLESNICVQQPCMQLLATGGAGALYVPELFEKGFLNEKLIQELCPLADDLWLKAAEVMSGIPVVLARPNRTLKYLPGSQETALYHLNVDENRNDVQIKAINEYLDSKYGEKTLTRKITAYNGANYLSVRDIMDAIYLERQTQRQMRHELSEKLKRAYADKSAINARLQKAYADKSAINARLQKAFADKSEINAKLQKTYKEKAERGVKIKELEKELQEMKERKHRFFGFFGKKNG
ncbi:MAG: glycosyltransferase [Erysipelotrichaceae bacterium]|nr:glycosyltransferase [Erysipelotrichaceae bacterium]